MTTGCCGRSWGTARSDGAARSGVRCSGAAAPSVAARPEVVDRHPDLQFVLDHFGKPQLAEQQHRDLEGPHRGPRDASSGIVCKLSGLATEAAANWQVADLREARGPCRSHASGRSACCGAATGL